MTTVNRSNDNKENIAPDYRVFDLRGSHDEIGREMGRSNPRFAVMPWWSAPAPRRFALDCASIAGELHPPLLDEYRGYAEAQSIEYEDLLQGVCRTSLRRRVIGGCTSLAWRSEGRVLVGRNYDFGAIQTTRLRIRLAPDAALPTVGMQGSLPGGRYDGGNSCGLFVSLHVVMADDPDRRVPGVPFHLVPRILLETCADAAAALDAIMRLPHLNSFNYLLADPTRFVAVEAHPSRLRAIEPEGDFLAVTNHYRHPDMIALQGRRNTAGSKRRVDRAQSWLAAAHSADAWEEVRLVLRDHTAPLCEHRPHNSTLWSVIADLGARRVAYAPGTPCRIAHQPVDWPLT
jgi:hypothetical protein